MHREGGDEMRVTAKINNSAVLCIDDNGEELVAFGKGIGFCELGSEVDLQRVQRTFYDLDPQSSLLLEEIDPRVLSLASQTADLVRDRFAYRLSSNFTFVLADHLSFALKRIREGIAVHMPLVFDVEQQYPAEYEVGLHLCKRMSREFGLSIPQREAAGIALCFVNNMDCGAEGDGDLADDSQLSFDELLERSVCVIEKGFGIDLDRSSFNFSRFATHLQYLYMRASGGKSLTSENASMYPMLAREYPDASDIADSIAAIFLDGMSRELSDEELLYLIMHINRLCEKAQIERCDVDCET